MERDFRWMGFNGITTSSTSLKASRFYAIFDASGNLFKFGVTDAGFKRFQKSLALGGTNATGYFSEQMFKYQAHIMEKFMRSWHYASTGQLRLDGMKVPYPVNLTTGAIIKP